MINYHWVIFVVELLPKTTASSVQHRQASDFGRTLIPNTVGTDHAWGGNSFLAGGALKGGKILGRYPADFDQTVDKRGRIVPTVSHHAVPVPTLAFAAGLTVRRAGAQTPWEAPWKAIGEWFGVKQTQMDALLPNAKNFPTATLMSQDDLFQ